MHDNVSHYKKSCNKLLLFVRPLFYNRAHLTVTDFCAVYATQVCFAGVLNP